jgi:3-hydroxyethyl bacteriochlorophyllide a dehydrogenase
MHTTAVTMTGPNAIALTDLALARPGDGDAVVAIRHSAISTGTERLLWEGRMPAFPGMGYPLVPGYEAVGEVVEAGPGTGLRPGAHVFVPGADCYEGARGLFGAASRRVVARADRLARIDVGLGAEGALLALAATARHAVAGLGHDLPDLIVGHGTLGRLVARICVAAGGAPTVWEVNADRRGGARGYDVVDPETDARRDYACILDASGAADMIDPLIGRLAKGGELILAGFYPGRLDFAFAPAFMREARLRIAAEWTPQDLAATRELVEGGLLSLADLITHTRPAREAPDAYAQAFDDASCLKMVLDWEDVA